MALSLLILRGLTPEVTEVMSATSEMLRWIFRPENEATLVVPGTYLGGGKDTLEDSNSGRLLRGSDAREDPAAPNRSPLAARDF